MTATEVEFDLTLRSNEEVVATEPATTTEIPEETKALLEVAGLDHVPTVDEAKALLDARRAEIRTAVLMEADARDWCEDGTRKVCANLRLARPGNRDSHEITVTMQMTLTITQSAYTPQGALARMQRGGQLSKQWLQNHLYGRIHDSQILTAKLGDEEIDVTMLGGGMKP